MTGPSFWYVFYAEGDSVPYGIAEGTQGTDAPLLPKSGKEVASWSHVTLRLRHGSFADYQSSNIVGRLCSSKLRDIVDRHISFLDRLQWLDVTVIGPEDEERPYWILHFPVDFPVLDRAKSLSVDDGFVVKPVLSRQVVAGHQTFGLPASHGQTWFVSGQLKSVIQQAGCTNVSFGPVQVAGP